MSHQHSAFNDALMLALLGGGSLWAFFSSFKLVGEARLMENMPTSKIRSAAQGYVELDGHAQIIEDVSNYSPLSADPCLWWHFTVEHYEQRGKNKEWVVVDKGTSTKPFCILDATGRCQVQPEGAEVVPSTTIVWHGFSRTPKPGSRKDPSWWARIFGSYRYTEKLIYAGDPIYALGLFETLHAEPGTPGPTPQQVDERMAQWKADPQRMKLFDTNHDGVVDTREWMAARRVAQTQLERETALTPQAVEAVEGIHTLRRSGMSGQPFLLSTEGQQQLCGEYRRRALTRLTLSIIGFTVVVMATLVEFFNVPLEALLPH